MERLGTFVGRLWVWLSATGLALAGCAVDGTEPPLPAGVSIAYVRLSPDSVRLDTSKTQQFSVMLRLSDSTSRTLEGPVFSSSGGAVTSGGMYSSPPTNGLYTVIARHPVDAFADTSRVYVQGTVIPPPNPGLTVLFSDGFESGNFSSTQSGVGWTGNAYVDVTSAIARTGSSSARFRQGTPLGDGSWSELRFGGLPRLNEVYMQYYLYMPSGAESPSVGPKVTVRFPGGNDKFFRLWADNYGAAPKVGASTWSRSGNIGVVGSEYNYVQDDGLVWGMGQGPTPAEPLVPLIVDANKGRWMQVRIRCKVSAADNRSGVIQIWADGVLVVNDLALRNYPPGGITNYFANGYILGWANSGFQAGQMMYVDDVSFSTGGFPN